MAAILSRPQCVKRNFRSVIFKLILVIDGWRISCEIVLTWTPQDLTDDKSTLVQVMAWCCQTTSHYLSQCWHSSLSPYGITRPQWVKNNQMNINTNYAALRSGDEVSWDVDTAPCSSNLSVGHCIRDQSTRVTGPADQHFRRITESRFPSVISIFKWHVNHLDAELFGGKMNLYFHFIILWCWNSAQFSNSPSRMQQFSVDTIPIQGIIRHSMELICLYFVLRIAFKNTSKCNILIFLCEN